MSSPSPGKKRMDTDVLKLIESKYEVNLMGDGLNAFVVKFEGPPYTPYRGGVWNVKVELPEQYPFRSPSIGFQNRIFHPNIDDFILIGFFVVEDDVKFPVISIECAVLYISLPEDIQMLNEQLLAYPNPSDPLNNEAAQLYLTNREEYNKKVKDYIRRYSSENNSGENDKEANSNGSLTDFSEDETMDMDL